MDSQKIYHVARLLTEASGIMNEFDSDISTDILNLADRVCTILEENFAPDEETKRYIDILSEDLKDEEVERYKSILSESLSVDIDIKPDIRNLSLDDVMNTLLSIKEEVEAQLEEEKNNGK